jgi:hypothetical protein
VGRVAPRNVHWTMQFRSATGSVSGRLHVLLCPRVLRGRRGEALERIADRCPRRWHRGCTVIGHAAAMEDDMTQTFPAPDDADPDENPPDSDLERIPDLPPRPRDGHPARPSLPPTPEDTRHGYFPE